MIFGSRILSAPNTISSLLNGIVAYWSFDQQNSIDSIQFLTGADNNIVYTTSSINNYSARFNGVDSYISIPENESLKLTDSYTISAWIKPEGAALNNKGIFCVYNTGSTYGFSANLHGNKQTTTIRGAGGTTTYDMPALAVVSPWTFADSWNHCVWTLGRNTINNTTIIIHYLNGAQGGLLTSTTNYNISHSSGTQIRIGYDFFQSAVFNGNIDELAVWSRALSPLEVKRLYNFGSGCFFPF